jgi:hypothetical protein
MQLKLKLNTAVFFGDKEEDSLAEDPPAQSNATSTLTTTSSKSLVISAPTFQL